MISFKLAGLDGGLSVASATSTAARPLTTISSIKIRRLVLRIHLHEAFVLSFLLVALVAYGEAAGFAHYFSYYFSISLPSLEALCLLSGKHILIGPNIRQFYDLAPHEAPGEVEDREWQYFDYIKRHTDRRIQAVAHDHGGHAFEASEGTLLKFDKTRPISSAAFSEY